MTSKRLASYLFIFCLLILASCGKKSSGFDASIALDPSWTSIELPGRVSAVTAFSIELIEAIGAEERLKLAVYQKSWSNLILGLQEGEYQAICSPMQPYLFYEKLYVFSDVYLATGPVLVVAVSSTWSELAEMNGREVATLRGSTDGLILEKYPEVLQRNYDSVQQALEDVSQGVMDGLILDSLTAEAFVNNLYGGKLKINSPPLTAEGIRLVGLQGQAPDLIQKFNRGLSRLKEKGIYHQLAQKWGLGEPIGPSGSKNK